MITKSDNGDIVAEWIRLYPDESWANGDRNTYTGKIVVSDWDGNIKKGFTYDKNGNVSSYSTVQNPSLRINARSNVSDHIIQSNEVTNMPNNPIINNNKTSVIYKDINGNCWENIREIPAPTGIGVILERKEVDCMEMDKPVDPSPTTNPPRGLPVSEPCSGLIPTPKPIEANLDADLEFELLNLDVSELDDYPELKKLVTSLPEF